jgi:hypothetical protein
LTFCKKKCCLTILKQHQKICRGAIEMFV